MTTTPSLTTALTNALPVLNALMVEAMRRHEHQSAKMASVAIDAIHANGPFVEHMVIGTLEGAPWFRKGQPVIDELRRFL